MGTFALVEDGAGCLRAGWQSGSRVAEERYVWKWPSLGPCQRDGGGHGRQGRDEATTEVDIQEKKVRGTVNNMVYVYYNEEACACLKLPVAK